MLEIVDLFIEKLMSRFESLISVCIIGSRLTSKFDKSSDLDIIVLLDNTASLKEDEENIKSEIRSIALSVNKIIHCQIMFLTNFWNYVSNGSPVTFTMLRDAKVYYDTGFFETLQKLLRAGFIKPKTEDAERQLFIAKQLMKMTYHSINRGLVDNLQGAVVSATQSLLMHMGREPPAPKQIPDAIKELANMKLIDEEYYLIARKIIQIYKEIEHGIRSNLNAQELQVMYNYTNKFVIKMEELIQKTKKN
jgi:predicted nucleotidyltransferase